MVVHLLLTALLPPVIIVLALMLERVEEHLGRPAAGGRSAAPERDSSALAEPAASSTD
ncbi:hypothetical protein [Pseudonocardia xinjiangensis]|uniref:Uncharacterized protein n=1 Tax=Pseudonocardia xinjiangensis TaxID=75289 RepID=A0ABX1RPK7_9PSEU|nr:hypothetical protein [Pseudonocardia xinjiangensis]NMH81035.1 hypothetical protein [Pseudonocardia xinjiangensis]